MADGGGLRSGGARVATIPALAERDELNELTAIKLALQLLERRAELPPDQRELLRTALAATDRLGARLLAGVLERRRRGLSVQAQELQDHDDHHDRADDRQEHDLPFPAPAGPGRYAAWPLAASRPRAQAPYLGQR